MTVNTEKLFNRALARKKVISDHHDIRKRIEKNRDEIDTFLRADLPLDIIYFNIRRLAASNERLIDQLKLTNQLDHGDQQ